MTVDTQVFVQLLSELETYYKREFTPFVKQIWFRHLSERLSTEEFITAVEQAIVSKQFMPSPQELVEVVKGDAETLALQEWDLCAKAAARGDREMLRGLSSGGASGTTPGWRVAQAGDGYRRRPALAEEGVCVGVEVYPCTD